MKSVRFRNQYGRIISVPASEVNVIKMMQENPDLTALDSIDDVVSPTNSQPVPLRLTPVEEAPQKQRAKSKETPKDAFVPPPDISPASVYPPYEDLWGRIQSDRPEDAEEVFLLAQDIPDYQNITRKECADLWLYIHDKEEWMKQNGRNNY